MGFILQVEHALVRLCIVIIRLKQEFETHRTRKTCLLKSKDKTGTQPDGGSIPRGDKIFFHIFLNPFTGAGDFFRHRVVELFKNS